MSCFCSRRRSSRLQASLQPPNVAVAIKARDDVERRGTGPNLRDLSDEVLSTILLSLRGAEVAACLGPVARFLQHRLDEDASNPLKSLWARFLKQEFHGDEGKADAAKSIYKVLIQRRRCNTIEWRRVPCQHTLGAREGSPGMFFRYGRVFVFGGWGSQGPTSDLHVGPLSVPLRLQSIPIEGPSEGRRPPPTYEGKLTVLDEGRDLGDYGDFSVRVLVTGGYLHGGYFGESSSYGLMEISGKEDVVRARWLKTGEMMPRSNHSATYVPPKVAGCTFPSGYVLAFGGNTNGSVSSSLDLLDLSSLTWVENISCDGEAPAARNSHSATLLQCEEGDGILIVGGGSGDERNGGPPRGGQDLTSPESGAYWLLGLDGLAHFRWKRQPLTSEAPLVHGRGHVAVPLSGTDTVVLVSGGRAPTPHCTAFSSSHQTWMENVPGRSHPSPRAFGGGCALPNGMLMVYGGWNPRQGTYNCFWAACVDEVGSKTDFFQKLAEAPQEPEVENDDSDEDSMFSIPMMLRMAQMAHLDHGRVGLQRQNFGTGGYPGFFEGAEEEDEEHEELEELDDDTDEVTSSSEGVAEWDLSDA